MQNLWMWNPQIQSADYSELHGIEEHSDEDLE